MSQDVSECFEKVTREVSRRVKTIGIAMGFYFGCVGRMAAMMELFSVVLPCVLCAARLIEWACRRADLQYASISYV